MNWKIIKTKKDYNIALKRLEIIFDSKKSDPTFDEAELLILLIEKYETETELTFPEPDPIETIKYKMEMKNLRSKDLSAIIGSKSKASELLNRKRKLSLPVIRKLNKELGISAETLIQDYKIN